MVFFTLQSSLEIRLSLDFHRIHIFTWLLLSFPSLHCRSHQGTLPRENACRGASASGSASWVPEGRECGRSNMLLRAWRNNGCGYSHAKFSKAGGSKLTLKRAGEEEFKALQVTYGLWHILYFSFFLNPLKM